MQTEHFIDSWNLRVSYRKNKQLSEMLLSEIEKKN